MKQKLADAGLEKDTLVTFISDNGGPTMQGVTVNGASNTPLRGSKRTTLEGGVRVPFIVSWPGRVKPGVFVQPAIQLDLHATALAAAGVEIEPEWKLDGVDLLPFLAGQKTTAPHEALYWRFGEQMAIRVGDFKLVRYDTIAEPSPGERQARVTAAKLYDLGNDVGETKDLAPTMPDKLKELQATWEAWNATLAKPLWGGKGDSDAAEPGAPQKKRRKPQPGG